MRSPSRSEGFGAESVLACRLCLIRTGLRRARLWRIPVLERPPRPHSVGGGVARREVEVRAVNIIVV